MPRKGGDCEHQADDDDRCPPGSGELFRLIGGIAFHIRMMCRFHSELPVRDLRLSRYRGVLHLTERAAGSIRQTGAGLRLFLEEPCMSDHVREHRSLLAAAETRLLVWMAQRIPRAVNSDHLTGLALGAMVLAGAGFALARWDLRTLWLTVIGLGLNWFGDSLDGTLARVRRAERPRYGFYVDHVVDIVGISALFAGLAASGFMTPVVALAL